MIGMRIDYGPTVATDVVPDGCRVAARVFMSN
jgi:hypothetical protein